MAEHNSVVFMNPQYKPKKHLRALSRTQVPEKVIRSNARSYNFLFFLAVLQRQSFAQ